jgi:hypothetical protein
MKKILGTLALTLLLSTAGHAVTIAFWSFNSATPLTPDEGAGTFVDATGAGPSTYVAGTAYGTYVAGSAMSRTSPSWGSGSQSTRFYEIRANASTLSALSLRLDGRISGTGPTRIDLYYSTDGGGTYTAHTSFSLPTTAAWVGQSFADLSSISGLNNNSDVRFRLCPMSAASSGGTLRLDNVLVQGLPEPGLLLGLLGGLVLLLPRMR